MFKTMQGRVLVILAALAVAVGAIYQKGIKLGLDLQGGMHLALEIEDPDGTLTPEARSEAIQRAERIIRTRIDEFGVTEPLIQRVGSERLIVELAGIDNEVQAKSIIQQSAFLEWKLVLPTTEVDNALARVDRQIVAALGPDRLREMGRAVEAPANDVASLLFGGDSAQLGDSASAGDSTQAGDSTAGPEGDSTAAAPGDQEVNLRPFSSLLSRGDGTYLVAEEEYEIANEFLQMPEVQRALPRDVSLQWGWTSDARGARNYRELYVLADEPFLTGDMLENATATRDPQFNQAMVNFELSRRGGRIFSRVTSQNIQERIAIVLDQEVVSAPVVQDRIGASGRIELGASPLEEARDLALVLRAGALPAPLEIVEERTVGPSLGADSVEQGSRAGIVGLALVVLVMIFYYKFAGVLAVLALAVYVTLVMGGLAAMEANLSLPGIAGLILSVGMAVDANVLIFERIREELDAGRTPRTAVDEGFAQAFSAILDANITTLLTALILFAFGTGPVQGFAVTLSIGIVASFFSALFVTRTLFQIYLSRRAPRAATVSI